MQRRTSQTFQRLRKLSDSLVSAIVPNPSRKSTAQDSFLSYDNDKKGWNASFSSGSARAHAPIHRRPSFRNGQHVSKEDIRYPLLEPSLEQLQLDRKSSADALSARARSKRPERPREEDLPYGAPGSIPKALAPAYVAPPPAVGARRPHKTRAHAEETRSSVPFPHPGSGARERAVEVGRMQREKPLPEPPRQAQAGGRSAARAQQPPAPRPAPAPDTFLNLFASASVPASKPAPAARAPAVAREVYDPALPRPHPYAQAQPTIPQPYARVRRISSTGDVHPPSHHSRPRDENAPARERERRHPDLRPSRSTPLRLHENRGRERERVPLPPAPAPMYPYPVSPQRPLVHVAKPRPRNVPRDVSPEYNPQRLPTPRRSREEVRSYYESQQQQPQSVAAQVQAGLRVQQTAAPRPVRVDAAQAHARPMAAQLVRPGRDAERERERARRAEREREREARHLARAQGTERRRVLRPTHTCAVEVEYYGMSDAFSQEITIALADPERAHPLPADWRVGPAAPGTAYGTVRPLVTKKSRQMAGAM